MKAKKQILLFIHYPSDSLEVHIYKTLDDHTDVINDDGRANADEFENEDDINEDDEDEKLPFFRFIITSKHLLKQAVDKCNTDATV